MQKTVVYPPNDFASVKSGLISGCFIQADVSSINHVLYLLPNKKSLHVITKKRVDALRFHGSLPLLMARSIFTKAYKAGVKCAFGNDAGVYAQGKNRKEFVFLAEGGITAIESTAPVNYKGAELRVVAEIPGTNEKGKLAGIIAIDIGQVTGFNIMGKVVYMIKDGVLYKKNKPVS